MLSLTMGGTTALVAQSLNGIVSVEVRSENGPVAGATVVAGKASAITDANGHASLSVPPGATSLSVRMADYLEQTAELVVEAGREHRLEITLVSSPEVEEEVVVVATTRTGRRLEDQPTRVEVLDREEIEEKVLMTPGDIVMMLNEMGGLRVQATSPSIGAAAVRVQGMKGRYTRFFSDGLPLFGQQVGGLGLLQIPPMDLGQVEVIKGVASSLYGAGAMGGVVNLLSRRPGVEGHRDMLLNQSSLGATDGVIFLASPARVGWSASLLGGGHRQSRVDRANAVERVQPRQVRQSHVQDHRVRALLRDRSDTQRGGLNREDGRVVGLQRRLERAADIPLDHDHGRNDGPEPLLEAKRGREAEGAEAGRCHA